MPTPPDRPSRRASRASHREPAERERTVQNSVSLRLTQWERLDVLGDLTRWGRSGTVAQAVDLLTALPVPVAQRLATLQRTAVASTLRERLRAAVAEAVAAAEEELGDDPWAEYDAALAAVGRPLARSPAAALSEEELVAAAEQAKQASRQARRGRRGGAAA